MALLFMLSEGIGQAELLSSSRLCSPERRAFKLRCQICAAAGNCRGLPAERGDAVPTAEGMPPPGGGGSRGLPAETKGGKGTVWFPCPLLTPPNPPLRRDALRLRGETGVTGGSVPCVGSLMGRCYALNLLCVIRRA